MHLPIQNIKGITVETAAILNGHGIRTSDQLLQVACTPAAREELAKRLGINVRTILEYANRADLARVKGIGSVYSDLLDAAGVDTVKELAVRNPENLRARLLLVIAAKDMRVRAPALSAMRKWVAAAKEMPAFLEY